MNFFAIWQVHLWSPVTHSVIWDWGSMSAKRRFWGQTPAKACNCKLPPNHQSCPSCHLESTNKELGELATMILPFAKLLLSLLSWWWWTVFMFRSPRWRQIDCFTCWQ